MTVRKAPQASAVNKGAARYAMLLDSLAGHYPDMISLAEIARLNNLPKPSAFRLMKALQEVGFAAYDSDREAYLLGARMMDLGAKALSQNFAVTARPSLMRIADETRDTAFGVLAENDHMHCLLRITGSYPIRTLSLEEGDIWPLGIGAVGMALLAAHDDAFVERYLTRYIDVIGRYMTTGPEALKKRVLRTREEGFARSEGDLLSGMSAVGVAIYFPGTERPMGAISVAAVSNRLADLRLEEVVGLLRREAELIGSSLAARRAAVPLKG